MRLCAQLFRTPAAAEPSRRRKRSVLPVEFGFSYHSSPLPTLIVNRNMTAARELADRLSTRGFESKIACDCPAAQEAVRSHYYRSLVLFIEIGGSVDWACVELLRKRTLQSWIIVVMPFSQSNAQDKVFRYGGDALLVAPYAFEDLFARLSAFLLRARPV